MKNTAKLADINPATASIIEVRNDGELVLRIDCNGKIVLGDGLSTEEATQMAAQMLAEKIWDVLGHLKSEWMTPEVAPATDWMTNEDCAKVAAEMMRSRHDR